MSIRAIYSYIDDLLERDEKLGFEKDFKLGFKKGFKKGFERGIEIGKKLTIYETYQRGFNLEALSNIFALPVETISAIIEEMKNAKEGK